jgi:predicted nuclease with TOPRIM domain
MTENEENATQELTLETEEDAVSGLTHEQALKELAKVRREAAKHRTEKQQLKATADELQKYKDAEKTELEKVQERAQRAETEAAELRREKAARAAAKTAGLGSEWVDLVRGDTEEELLASAEALAERVGKAKVDEIPAGFNSAGGKAVKAPESASQAFRDFLKNNR